MLVLLEQGHRRREVKKMVEITKNANERERLVAYVAMLKRLKRGE